MNKFNYFPNVKLSDGKWSFEIIQVKKFFYIRFNMDNGDNYFLSDNYIYSPFFYVSSKQMFFNEKIEKMDEITEYFNENIILYRGEFKGKQSEKSLRFKKHEDAERFIEEKLIPLMMIYTLS